jgi:putative ABC transport system substrate-binding protein
MKRILNTSLILTATAVLLSACSVPADGDEPQAGTVTIGVFEMTQSTVLDEIVASFEDTVRAGAGDALSVEFEIQNANGEQSLITSIARDFASSDYDAFAVLGTPAVLALAAQVTDRPIFAIAIGDPVGAGLADSLQAPGGNVTGSVDYVDPALLLADLLEFHPDLNTVGTLYDPANQNMQVWMPDLRAAAADRGLEIVESTVAASNEVSQAARSLVDRADIVLIGPDAAVLSGIDALGAAMLGASLPLYTIGGDPSVPGVLASLGPDYIDLGVAAGEVASQVLLGAEAASTPFAMPSDVSITVNGALLEQYGVRLPESLADRTSTQ